MKNIIKIFIIVFTIFIPVIPNVKGSTINSDIVYKINLIEANSEYVLVDIDIVDLLNDVKTTSFILEYNEDVLELDKDSFYCSDAFINTMNVDSSVYKGVISFAHINNITLEKNLVARLKFIIKNKQDTSIKLKTKRNIDKNNIINSLMDEVLLDSFV